MSAPRVFISHATEDKQRFVLGFAERLRASGVDAWLDQWEMLPGDSLVDKIFEEGIKGASAFVIVLSATSVRKPWVREELNAAVVKRLSSKCRVIPVILDECEVPECLRATLWQRIHSLEEYDNDFTRILNALHERTDRPPLGEPPRYVASASLLNLHSLTKVDNLVLEALCEESVRTNDMFVISLECLDALSDAGISDDELGDSLQVLGGEHHIELSGVMGSTYRGFGISHVSIPTCTFDTFAKAKWLNYDQILLSLVSGLVNEGWETDAQINMALATAPRLCDHLVRLLEDSGNIKVSRHMGGYSIWEVSPKLKRALKDASNR